MSTVAQGRRVAPAGQALALRPEHGSIVRVLIIGVLLPLLDMTMVSVALQDIGAQWDAPLSATQWVTTAYTLAAASIVAVSGWAANRLGAKRLWIASLVTFLAGTLFSAMAWNLNALIVGRVIQGLATGLMMPVMQTILVNAVGADRAKAALAAVAMPSVIAPILGPLIGGLLLQHASWRDMFWLHVPLCLLGIVLGALRLPADPPLPPKTRFDVPGFLLLSPAMVLMVDGLSQSGAAPAGAVPRGLGSCALGVCLLLAFAVHARRRGAGALVDLAPLRRARFRACACLLFLSSTVYYAGLLLLPLYFTQLGHYSVVSAGLLIALHGVGALVSRRYLAPLSQAWRDRRLAMVSIGAMTLGTAALCLPQSLQSPWALCVIMLLRGAGVGAVTIQAMSSAYVGLERAAIAHASSMTRMLAHLGAAVGAAGSVALVGLSTSPEGAYGVRWITSGMEVALLATTVVSLLCALPAARLEHVQPPA